MLCRYISTCLSTYNVIRRILRSMYHIIRQLCGEQQHSSPPSPPKRFTVRSWHHIRHQVRRKTRGGHHFLVSKPKGKQREGAHVWNALVDTYGGSLGLAPLVPHTQQHPKTFRGACSPRVLALSPHFILTVSFCSPFSLDLFHGWGEMPVGVYSRYAHTTLNTKETAAEP